MRLNIFSIVTGQWLIGFSFYQTPYWLGPID